MEEQLTKKYGLPTAAAMVIGIVIGSGIFFCFRIRPLFFLAIVDGGVISTTAQNQQHQMLLDRPLPR